MCTISDRYLKSVPIYTGGHGHGWTQLVTLISYSDHFIYTLKCLRHLPLSVKSFMANLTWSHSFDDPSFGWDCY